KLIVAETPWERLSQLDVGKWKSDRFAGEKMPRLGDVLDILPPGKIFFIEIKSGPESVPPIRRILEEKKADPKRVVLITFDEVVVRACLKQLPAYQTHWISFLKDFDQGGRAELYAKQFAAMGATGFQFNATSPVTAAWLGELKKKHVPLTSWTVDDVVLARKMIGFGVDHITTNRPGPLRKELRNP